MSPLCSTAPSHTYTCLYTSLTCPPQISILVYSYSWVQLPTERFQTMINLLYHIFIIQSFFCLQNLQSSFIYYVFSPSFIYQASELQLYRHRSSTVSYCICILQSSFIYSICRPHSSKTSAVIVYLPYFMFSCIYATSAASLLIIYTTSAVIVNKLNNHICSHC